MSAELEIAEQFKKTYDQYSFLFQPVDNKNLNKINAPEYISRDFRKIAEKIDELFNAPSIHDYILNFSKNNREIKLPDYEHPELIKSLRTVGSATVKTKLINPLKELIIINDENIENDPIRFNLFNEQLVINFGIELCIALSELMEPKRSNYIKKLFVEPIDYLMKNKKDYLKLNEKQRKDASTEQGKRFYPKVWELYTDNQELKKILSLHIDALQIAIKLEPYFLQTQIFHRIFSYISVPTTQRFNFTKEFFLNLEELKLPTPSLKNISRSLMILRTFNPDVFKSESKTNELIIPALNKASIFQSSYNQTTMRTAYFATMRNYSGSKF